MSAIRPRVVGIIQARMGSTRLPGKTLADILGKPLLEQVLTRVQASKSLDDIIIATTVEPEDTQIVKLATRCGAQHYCGSSNDVLDRFHRAAEYTDAGLIVRITADDPFKDPQILDEIVGCMRRDQRLDYVSNTIEPTYPEGLDIEVISRSALERAWQEATLPSEREHVTPYIWKHPESFHLANVKYREDLSSLRWTIDCEEDLRFAREVYARLSWKGIFLMADILELLHNEPELMRINRGIGRNEGYQFSIAEDRGTEDDEEDFSNRRTRA